MSEENIDINAKQGVWNPCILSVPGLSLSVSVHALMSYNPEDTNLDNYKETNAHQDSLTALANGEEIVPKHNDAKEEQSADSMVS